jgi:DNA-binding IclR family transcriptional regulator
MANNDLVQSLYRGIEILEMLSDSNDGLRLNEIAESLSVKPPTAHNLLRTLIAKDFVRKTPNNLHLLGPAACALGANKREETFIKRIKAEMSELAHKLPGRTITFCELSGGKVKARFRIHFENPDEVQEPNDIFLHLYANASGLIFQAFAENEEKLLDLREEAPFFEYGAHLWKSPAKLNSFLRDVKEKGYACPPFEGQDFFRLAAPVFDKKGNLAGAIGASIRTIKAKSENDKKEMIKEVTASAGRISKDL